MNLSDEYSDEQCYRAISYVDNEISLYRKEGDSDAAEKYDCILSMLCRLQDLIEDLQQENDASADLTWRVEAPGVGVVARFHCRDEARRYMDAALWAGATITGPDSQPVDHGEDEQTESEQCCDCGETGRDNVPYGERCDRCDGTGKSPQADMPPAYEGNPDDEKPPRGFVPPGYVLHDEGYYTP